MEDVKLFQIADVSFHLHDQVITSYSTESDGESNRLWYSQNVTFSDTQYRNEIPEVNWEGDLIAGDGEFFPHEKVQRLKSLVGAPAPIISYLAITEEQFSIDCGCRYNSCDCKVIWFECLGVIRSVEVERNERNQPARLSIVLELTTKWKILDNYRWYFGSGQEDFFNSGKNKYGFCDKELICDYPTCEDVFGECVGCKNFVYRRFNDDLLFYKPELWLYKAVKQNSQLLEDESVIGEGLQATAYSCKNNNRWYSIFSNQNIWGYPPLSIYHFTNLSKEGLIYVKVFSNRIFTNVTQETKLDLSKLNQQLNDLGYGNILENDELVFGDVQIHYEGYYYRPAFLMRNDVILKKVYPEIEFVGDFPGQLGVGNNRTYIQTPKGTAHSFVHYFRRV